MSLPRCLVSLVIAMPAAAILQTIETADLSTCSSPTMASNSAHSPANVRSVGSPAVAPTAIDQTPDSEKVRRCSGEVLPARRAARRLAWRAGTAVGRGAAAQHGGSPGAASQRGEEQ